MVGRARRVWPTAQSAKEFAACPHKSLPEKSESVSPPVRHNRHGRRPKWHPHLNLADALAAKLRTGLTHDVLLLRVTDVAVRLNRLAIRDTCDFLRDEFRCPVRNRLNGVHPNSAALPPCLPTAETRRPFNTAPQHKNDLPLTHTRRHTGVLHRRHGQTVPKPLTALRLSANNILKQISNTANRLQKPKSKLWVNAIRLSGG